MNREQFFRAMSGHDDEQGTACTPRTPNPPPTLDDVLLTCRRTRKVSEVETILFS